MNGMDRAYASESGPYYGADAEVKCVRESLTNELDRAVARLFKEVEGLTQRINPVLSAEGPEQASPDYPRGVSPHSSVVAQKIADLHKIADDLAYLSHRVEL